MDVQTETNTFYPDITVKEDEKGYRIILNKEKYIP